MADDIADMIQESYGDTFEPEVAGSVQTGVSVRSDSIGDQDGLDHQNKGYQLRASVESVPEAEYSSFAATGSGPGILESPHASSEYVLHVEER